MITKNMKSSFTYNKLDLLKNNYSIYVYSSNYYYLSENPLIIKLDKSNIPLEKQKISTSTWVIDNIIKSKVIIDKKIVKIEKYKPTFTKYQILYKITWIIDSFVEKNILKNITIEKENKITAIRNKTVQILEKLDQANKSEIQNIANNFKVKFAELKNELK
jgi:hypothetical protein